MHANDVLRRLRFALDNRDHEMIACFEQGGVTVTRPQLTAWLLDDEHPEFEECPDRVLGQFLDGLIIERRGPADNPRPPLDRVTNNDVLRKLRIAFELKQPEMLAIMETGGRRVSPGELSALFRNPQHKNFRVCGDQFLRTFLVGLTRRFRPDVATD